MKRKWKVAIVLGIVLCLTFGLIYALTQSWIKIPGKGKVKKIGVEAYWDSELTQIIDLIDWGLIGPNESLTKDIYVQNLGNVNASLSFFVNNWNPINASNYLTISWNGTGILLEPMQAKLVTLKLSATKDLNAEIFPSFSFDITILGSQV